jgi:hypothetical protein
LQIDVKHSYRKSYVQSSSEVRTQTFKIWKWIRFSYANSNGLFFVPIRVACLNRISHVVVTRLTLFFKFKTYWVRISTRTPVAIGHDCIISILLSIQHSQPFHWTQCNVRRGQSTVKQTGIWRNSSLIALGHFIFNRQGERVSVVGWSTMLQAGRSLVLFPMRSLEFSIGLNLPAALWSSGRLSL